MTSYRSVRSIERALLVLRAMNRRPIARVQELAEDTGLSAPTLVRILETLCGLGYVHKHSRQTGYTLAEKVLELSSGYHGLPLFIEAAKPVLSDLTERLLWPAALATLEDVSMVVRLSTIPESPLAHAQSTLQKHLDLLTRAHGRAYLAFCPEDERNRLYARLCESSITQLSILELRDRLEPVLTRIRKLGFAERHHELDPETTTLAMPAMSSGRVVATVGITCFRGARPDRKKIVAELAAAVARIEDIAGETIL